MWTSRDSTDRARHAPVTLTVTLYIHPRRTSLIININVVAMAYRTGRPKR